METVRKTMLQNNILYTEYTYCEKGKLFDETIAKKNSGPSIPLKKVWIPKNMVDINLLKQRILLLLSLTVKKGSV